VTIDMRQVRHADLVDEYTAEMTKWADSKVPPILNNADYADRTSALMIALTRQFARAAAAFGEAHQVDPEKVAEAVVKMFANDHVQALTAIRIGNEIVETVQ
jgi:uncharacterized protein (DUF2267 family)